MANGDIIKRGTLYVGGTKQIRPTRPWQQDSKPDGTSEAGDIPSYTVGQTIEIRNTDSSDAYRIQWVSVSYGGKDLLIADRNLLVNISWDDLNAQGLISGKNIYIDGGLYKFRLLSVGSNMRNSNWEGGTPTSNEWDQIICNEAGIGGLPTPNSNDTDNATNSTDYNGTHNRKWNWYYCFSWGQEKYSSNTNACSLRGFDSARLFISYYSSARGTSLGFRPVLEILNSTPLISDTDRNLGSMANFNPLNYTVTDVDGGAVNVVEKLDGAVIKSYAVTLGATNTLTIQQDTWRKLLNGSHTVTITATDNVGANATRTFSFTKAENEIEFTLTARASANMPTLSTVKLAAEIQAGANLIVEVTNNGLDNSPMWEDCTNAVIGRRPYAFKNKTKTNANWGYNVRVKVNRNGADGDVFIKNLVIGYNN